MLQLVIGAVMISFSAVFVKLVHVPPTVSGFYRVFFGGLILLVFMLLRRQSLALKPRALLVLTLAAFFFALDLFLWHRSILYVGPGIATLLANFQVFVLAAVGVLFLHEKLTLPQWLAILLAMAGLALLVGADWAHVSPEYRYGVVLSLLAAVSYAGYLLALRSSRSGSAGSSPYAVITVVSLLTAAMLAATMGVEGVSFAIPSWTDSFWLVLYGLVPQVLGWVLISSSMNKVGASQVGLVLLLQPACAFIWDGLFFGRRFTVIELTGAAITLIAIYLGTLKAARKSS